MRYVLLFLTLLLYYRKGSLEQQSQTCHVLEPPKKLINT